MNTRNPSPLDHRVLCFRRRDASDDLPILRRAPFGRDPSWLSVAIFESCIAGTVVFRGHLRYRASGPTSSRNQVAPVLASTSLKSP